ncbi:MAG: hypothetical protein U0163_00230 [Gemmatimonadaceae bacterium]
MARLTAFVAALWVLVPQIEHAHTVHAQAAAAQTTLPQLLDRASTYVAEFRAAFVQVIGVEHYQQFVRQSRIVRSPRNRTMDAEVFFAAVGEPPTFMTVRSVSRVDGRSVPGAHERIVEALSAPAVTRQQRLRTLASEGARYNLGQVARTFNDPTLALMFLGRDLQGRFQFVAEAPRRVNGQLVHRLRFEETARPPLIRDDRDDLDATIRGAVDLTDEGRALETSLTVLVGTRAAADINVRYANSPSLGMLVPVAMDEIYRNDDGPGAGVTIISCVARYTDYRKFETSVRILP